MYSTVATLIGIRPQGTGFPKVNLQSVDKAAVFLHPDPDRKAFL